MRPESRREQLLSQSVGNELVIYDERTHEAHRLSQTAAHVWRLADGERDLSDLATELRESIETSPGDDVATLDEATSLELVRVALSELDRAGLLARAVPDLAVLGEPISRRKMLGVTAALLPVVASIVAPTPAMAATCTAVVNANPNNFVAAGGQTTVTITTSCSWEAKSLEGYITPVGTVNGVGNGTAVFSVAGNSAVTPRSGTINVSFPGNNGSYNITIMQQGLTGVAPVAVISSANSVSVGTPITFDGSGSTGSISSYSWNFGDSTTGSGPSVTHTYPTSFLSPFSSTTVTVTLTVSGPSGSHTASKSITVSRTY